MPFFSFKKKKKDGRVSNISQLRSPYLKKLPNPEKTVKKVKKSSLHIPPARLKPPSNKGKKILAALLSLGIVSYCIYALFFSDYFLVKKYKVEEEGVIIEANDLINQILEKELNRNLVTVNEEEIRQEIRSVQPEINTLKILKVFPDTLKVQFEKYPTIANITNIVGGVQKKFLVDSQGFLTEENNENPNLPYIKIETKDPLQVRNSFLSDPKISAARLTYMIQAINLFEEKFGMKILFAQYKVREREVHLYTEKYFYVMIDMEKELGPQLEKLKKATSKLDIYTVPLLYIDLRISGNQVEKVIFKRKT